MTAADRTELEADYLAEVSGWISATPSGAGACSSSNCDGCCEANGECRTAAQTNNENCSAEERGGACGRCEPLWSCSSAVCQPPPPPPPTPAWQLATYDITFVRADYTGTDADIPDDATWSWPRQPVGGVAGEFHSYNFAAVNQLVARDAPSSIAEHSMDILLSDYDWGNYSWRCLIQFSNEHLQAAMDDPSGYRYTTTCQNLFMQLTFMIRAKPPTSTVVPAGRTDITVATIEAHIVGQQVGTSVGPWTFERLEPRLITNLDAQYGSNDATVTFDLRTTSVDNTQPAYGRMKAEFQWSGTEWVLQSVESITFDRTF
jgi:hypothetical protein